MILYYTGTGNSKYIAQQISDTIGEPLYFINDALKSGSRERIDTGENVILVTPTYAWRIPHLVRDWLLQAELSGAKQIWFVMNCGSEIGNAAKYNRELAVQKDLRYLGTAQIVMPENYIAMFPSPTDAEAEAIIAKAQTSITEAAEALRIGREFAAPNCTPADRLKSSLVNAVFYPAFVKANAFTATDSCIGCSKCAQLCPLNNIRVVNRKPVWGKNCTHCMACISYCPTEAIEYGKHSVGRNRYRAPEK